MIFRKTKYCHSCGEEIKAIYKNTDHYKDFVGDTFLGYENHKCKSVLDRFKKIN